ncbi:MAG TPA: BACON domain-containing carbohydrate-binding protein [Thermoanaerobaculia bacterium]|nr:BACON domain-containing carbohydrate-binding protein [Thermoanaerobaculia bacterium]
MSRRTRRFGFFAFSLILLTHAAAASELTLAYPARKASPIPVGLQVLANGLELSPHAVCPEVEPNDDPPRANPITLPASCSGHANATDASLVTINYSDGSSDGIEDIFSITLATAMSLAIDLTWSSPGADLDLHVFRVVTGTTLAQVDISATGGSVAEGLVTDVLNPGTYYIGVSAWSGGSAYGLSVTQFTGTGNCVENANAICLSNGRFRVSATYQTGSQSGNAGAERLTGDTGYFWFFSNSNVELVLKVLDACGFNNRFWVFAGGLTDVQTTITITDTQTGATKQYNTTGGVAFAPIQDTDAFATCSGTACTYGVSPTPQQFTSAGGSGTVNLTSQAGCTWNATKSGDFITLTSGTSGSGNGTVGFTVAANSSTSSRSGTITAGGKVVTINQSGQTVTCTYTFTPPEANYTNAAATGSVNVATQSSCSWTATSNAPWITVTSGSSGTGNGTVGYSVAANSSSSLRTGSLSIGGELFFIEQSGSSVCTYSVSPTSQTVGFAAGSGGTIDVTTQAGCTWNATTTTPWITINNGSGTGSGSFTYTAAQNEATSSRFGSISVGGRTVSITQSGDTSKCTYNPPYTSKTFTWCGADSSYQMQTQSGCPWTITSNVPWLDVLAENRSGQVSASYIVERNDTGADRTGTITAGTFTATITQLAKPGSGGTYDGLWTGKTGSNRDVNICIANNALQKVDVRVSLNAFTFTCTTPLVSFQPINISGTSFSGPVSTYPEISNVTSTLSGSLGSPTAMSGSWTAFSGNWILLCGNSFAIGFGSTILASGNYTATKQP